MPQIPTSTAKAIKELGLVPVLWVGAKREELAWLILVSNCPQEKAIRSPYGSAPGSGKAIYTTPNVPADRLKSLRAATLMDTALLSEAKRSKRNVQWTSAEEVDRVNREVLSASDDVIAMYKAAQKRPKLNYKKLPNVADPLPK